VVVAAEALALGQTVVFVAVVSFASVVQSILADFVVVFVAS
jgi:hypothetical protein